MSKPPLLEPDREQLTRFVQTLFKYAGTEGFVSLRSFVDGGRENQVFNIEAVGLNKGLGIVIAAAEDRARRAAQARKSVVFSPVMAVLKSAHSAGENDILKGLVLSVELDGNAQEALRTLEAVLGPATVVVASGGAWVDGDGVVHDRLHAHWHLKKPACGAVALRRLKQARTLATQLVGADRSNKPVCHPIRWPGSWHKKAEPRLCRIVSINADAEIYLGLAWRDLEKKAGPIVTRPAADRAEDFAALSDAHAERVLAGILRVMAQSQDGERQNICWWCANRIAEMVRSGSLSPEALDALADVAENAGLASRRVADVLKRVQKNVLA
jgi:hypothetical protein